VQDRTVTQTIGDLESTRAGNPWYGCGTQGIAEPEPGAGGAEGRGMGAGVSRDPQRPPAPPVPRSCADRARFEP
jgi:hypothetical protein